MSEPHVTPSDVRVDPYSEARVYVVGSRQGRPNLPSVGCPFCPGGREAPDPYDVRWFSNRWPAMPGDRCEVVLYTPEHDATFWSIGRDGARKVIDLWAQRTLTLGSRDDVDYVLVFENRGPEVGATIPHPHGQIYAYDHIPARPATLLNNGWVPEADPGERLLAEFDGWRAWVPNASIYPLAVTLAPTERVRDLPSLTDAGRDGLAAMLVHVLAGLDKLWDRTLPYMLWFNQGPTNDSHPEAWLNVEIVSPWRSAGVSRFIAAAEVGGGEFFNPVIPEVLAEQIAAALAK
jgi:UDPglucose--hexose-1-phosphate uridylyltransferase